MAAGAAVRLLGPTRVRTRDGPELVLRGHAARLLAWLALHPGRAWSIDDLAARLWPDGPPATARTAIQGHVSRLRRSLVGPIAIATVPGGYELRMDDACALDVALFTDLRTRAAASLEHGDAATAVRLLEDALGLWAGDALADLRADPRLAAEGRALDDRRLATEEALAEALIDHDDLDRALALLGRLVNEEPLREHRWGLLMTALTRAGRQTDALRTYRRAAAVLVERTGLDPGHELRRLETAILLQDPSLDVARWRPPPGSVPVALTDVVGRDRERATVMARLAGARVVTIVGPGGVGKTTLGLDLGVAAADTFADGVVVVDLGAGGPDEVGALLADAVGTPAAGSAGAEERARTPLTTGVQALAGRDVLVVLDGCEHVAAEAARLAGELVRAGPRIRVLATSQVALGVSGEVVVPLMPLAVPPEHTPPGEVDDWPAAHLLTRRLADHGCPVTGDEGRRAVAVIARAVDGLPLAIDLAAAAARSEALTSLARRLDSDATPVLEAEPPVGAGRRRLGAALDAAVDRLRPGDADLYAALSAFPATFDPAAAAAVAGLDEPAARAALARLADASLVVLDPEDRSRGRLLGPVRAHAAGRLDATAAAAAEDRLVTHCLAVASELDATVHTPAQAQVVQRFTDNLPTFRAALRRLLDGGDVVRAAALFDDLATCWIDSPAGPEARVWADELLALAHRLPPVPRVRLEVAAIHCEYAFELIAARLELAEATLVRATEAGDAFATAAAQVQVAIGLGWRDIDLDRTDALLRAARAGFLDQGERYWAAVALEFTGLAALRRLDVAVGIPTLEAAAAEHRAHGGPGDVAHALAFIGFARRAIGDLAGAYRAFDEARRVLGPVRVSTWLRASVGAAHAALGLGDLAAAGAGFRAAHDRAVEIGDHRIVGTALVGLAAVARAEGDDEHCVALAVAAADRALDDGDPTDAVTAAALLAELLVAAGATEEAAVVLGATDLVDDQVGVRVDFGLAHDRGPVREAVVGAIGADRAADLGGDGRVIGLGAAVRRSGERLLGVTPARRGADAPV